MIATKDGLGIDEVTAGEATKTPQWRMFQKVSGLPQKSPNHCEC